MTDKFTADRVLMRAADGGKPPQLYYVFNLSHLM